MNKLHQTLLTMGFLRKAKIKIKRTAVFHHKEWDSLRKPPRGVQSGGSQRVKQTGTSPTKIDISLSPYISAHALYRVKIYQGC